MNALHSLISWAAGAFRGRPADVVKPIYEKNIE